MNRTVPLAIAAVLALLFGLAGVPAGEPARAPLRAPALIELRDQFDQLQRLAFPATNVIVLTIADKKGADQIDGWVTALKARYGGRIEWRGLADVAGVPGLWRGKIRKHFRETRTHPVMMDWSGKTCAHFQPAAGEANVLILDRDGTVRERTSGPATTAAVARLAAALDAVLGTRPPSAVVPPAPAGNLDRPVPGRSISTPAQP